MVPRLQVPTGIPQGVCHTPRSPRRDMLSDTATTTTTTGPQLMLVSPDARHVVGV